MPVEEIKEVCVSRGDNALTEADGELLDSFASPPFEEQLRRKQVCAVTGPVDRTSGALLVPVTQVLLELVAVWLHREAVHQCALPMLALKGVELLAGRAAQ